MRFDINKVRESQARLETELATVFSNAAVGIGIDDVGKPVLDVMLQNEPTEAEKKKMPQKVDGVAVRYSVIGQVNAFNLK